MKVEEFAVVWIDKIKKNKKIINKKRTGKKLWQTKFTINKIAT